MARDLPSTCGRTEPLANSSEVDSPTTELKNVRQESHTPGRESPSASRDQFCPTNIDTRANTLRRDDDYVCQVSLIGILG